MSLLFGLLMLAGGGYLLYWALSKHTVRKAEWMKAKRSTFSTFWLSELEEAPKITVGYILGGFLLFIGLVLLLVGIFA